MCPKKPWDLKDEGRMNQIVNLRCSKHDPICPMQPRAQRLGTLCTKSTLLCVCAFSLCQICSTPTPMEDWAPENALGSWDVETVETSSGLKMSSWWSLHVTATGSLLTVSKLWDLIQSMHPWGPALHRYLGYSPFWRQEPPLFNL